MGLFDWIDDWRDSRKRDAAVRDKELTEYRYSSGGDMCGGSHRDDIRRVSDTKAKRTIADRTWHDQDMTVTEYLLDIGVLREIEAVFRKYSMQRWHRKKFTDMFVDDGASYGYHFRFGREEVWFSSQIYPDKYGDKLQELRDVVKRYMETAERLPGLVRPETEDDEEYRGDTVEGEVTFEVFEYSDNLLEYRLGNGTGEPIRWKGSCALYREGTEEPVIFQEDELDREVEPSYRSEEAIRLPKELEAGEYRLEAGGYTCRFTIQ